MTNATGKELAGRPSVVARSQRLPWRDGRCLVIDPDEHSLPRLCVMTGQTVDGPPRRLTAHRSLASFAIAAACVVLGIAWCVLWLEHSPLWVPLLGTLVCMAGAARFYEQGRLLPVQTQIIGHVSDEVVGPTFSWRSAVIAFGPVLCVVSIVLLFVVQFRRGASLDRTPLVLLTFAFLAPLIASLVVMFVGAAAWRPGPIQPSLRCTKQLGRLVWIKGVHPALLVQFPTVPEKKELETTAWGQV